MSAQSLLLSACCALVLTPVSGGDEQPVLTVSLLPEAVQFHVTGPADPFLGVVIGSLSPDLRHYLVDLPPLLDDFVVLGFGVGDGEAGYKAVLPESLFPPGIFVYAQGVTYASGVWQSSNVDEFVLDATYTGSTDR